MAKVALAIFVWMVSAGVVSAADAAGYRKAYFGATKPGTWAQYTMKVEGQADMGYLSTRLADEAGQQRVEILIEYMLQGKLTPAYTDYVLKAGYSLEKDALGFGKALVAMSSRQPGSPPYDMPPDVLDNTRKTMPDYGASAQFVGAENIGGKVSDRYRYTQKHPGNPAQIETGEIWLNENVPFGLVKQKAATREESGKIISQFEMLLIDSGVKAPAVQAAAVSKPAVAPGPTTLADAYRKGQVELAVAVASGDGRNLRVTFKNKGNALLNLTIPVGATTLDVGTPLDKLRLEAAAAKTLAIAPGATSPAVDLQQSGARRAVKGSFVITVYEGTPLYSGSVTIDTVKP
ncbi:MAG: hypothetical protein GZ089_12465 [Aromatoleum sp.]|nr:hypothetical protein [Aromatoleum sp.]